MQTSTASMSCSDSVLPKAGIISEKPIAGPPWVITTFQVEAGSRLLNSASEKLAGTTPRFLTSSDSGSGRPAGPWQVAQLAWKISARPRVGDLLVLMFLILVFMSSWAPMCCLRKSAPFMLRTPARVPGDAPHANPCDN
jgi:hypothetical protein